MFCLTIHGGLRFTCSSNLATCGLKLLFYTSADSVLTIGICINEVFNISSRTLDFTAVKRQGSSDRSHIDGVNIGRINPKR